MPGKGYCDPYVFQYALKISESRWKNPRTIGNLIIHTLCAVNFLRSALDEGNYLYYMYTIAEQTYFPSATFSPFKLYSLCWYNQKIATCVQKEKYNKHLNFYHLFHIFQQNTPKKKINIIIIDS